MTTIFVLLVSCKKEKKIVETSDNYKISFVFPDTVFVNELYDGKINYKNSLDSITTKVLDAKKPRYISYAFTITKDINYNISHLKKIEQDTIYTNSSEFIPLSIISFNQLGVNYIDGIITDKVEIENVSKNNQGELMTRVITNEFRVTKKVLVIKDRTKK
ncbi:hypothetical protein [[Flexibacter] sp. ATCC 35103]|uniref:hypothetical protein n=1 Tax=[Flexibacter] sp. ATCC 35103 TaxID=1937528 RepID=UPI000F50B7D1|nr:hypothetical protein [[Flexibacter] sp. ATCC 35103]